MADQQRPHWPWGALCVLGRHPPTRHRDPRGRAALQTPLLWDEDAERSCQSPRAGTQHAAPNHGDDTVRAGSAGARGLSERWLRSLPAPALGSQALAAIPYEPRGGGAATAPPQQGENTSVPRTPPQTNLFMFCFVINPCRCLYTTRFRGKVTRTQTTEHRRFES